MLSELKLGNGTSLLIFVNIVSALPTSIGETLATTEQTGNSAGLSLFFAAFLAITLGIVYVQEAERKIPINYASRYQAGGLSKSSYLPFKVSQHAYRTIETVLPYTHLCCDASMRGVKPGLA